MDAILKQYIERNRGFIELSTLVKESLKRKDKHKASIRDQLSISLDNLKVGFRARMFVFLEGFQDADELDFINAEIRSANDLLSYRKKYSLSHHLKFSREKYLRFLYEEKEFAHNNIKNLEQGSHLCSNRSRIDVAYFMLLGFQIGIFHFHSENDLALFIERNCTYDGGKKMKSVRPLLHNIRKDNIKTEHIKQKYLDYFDSLGR